MSEKFVTKKGKGATCYRIPRVVDGKTVYGSDYVRRIKRGKQQFYFKLGPEKRLAETISNEIDDFLRDPRNSIEDALRRFNPDSMLRDRSKLTVADIVRAHEKAEPVLELNPKVAKHYRGRLMWVVRRVMAHRSRKSMPETMKYDDALAIVEGFLVGQLNQRFISDLKMAEMQEAGDSVAEQNKVKRKVKSVMADARSVFSMDAIREYESYGLNLPDLSDFLKGVLFRRVTKTLYRLPDAKVIHKIFDDAHELRKEPNAYRIYLLALGAGLRRADILNCRQDWISGGEHPCVFLGLTEDWQQKGKGESSTELCPWAFKELSNLMEEGERVLTGTMTDGQDAARYLSKWLHSKGLVRKKPIHELRMLFGSWVANRRGLYAAQKVLRHKSPQVTNDHYADLIADEKILVRWEKRSA